MPSSDTIPDRPPTPPWLAAGVGLALLAAETFLLGLFFRVTFLKLATEFFVRRPYSREILVAVGLTAAAILAHVRSEPAPYRDAVVSIRRMLLQIAVFFLPFAAFLLLVSNGTLAAWRDGPALPRAAMAAFAAWVGSFALLVPAGAPVWPLVVRAVASVGIVAIAMASGELFWNSTAELTLRLVANMLALMTDVPILRPEPFRIGSADFQVDVAFGCSGYQGIGLIMALLAGYMWWFREALRFPRTLILIPVGMVLSYLANAVRIAALILIGIRFSPEVAVDGFHSNAGWLAFLVIGLGLIWCTSRMPFFARTEAEVDTPEPGSAALASGGPSAVATPGGRFGPTTAACLLPFLALLGITLLTGAFSAHGRLDLFYPVRVLAVAVVLWTLRRDYTAPTFDPSWTSLGLGAVVFAIWMVLAPNVADPDPEAAALLDPAALGPLWGPAWVVVRFLGYVVTVPIAEELAFRGFLARRLVGEDVESVPLGTFTWLSFLGSSLAFGLLHQSAWIPGTIAGVAYALALYQRRRIGDCIAAHATTNALLGAYVIATGSWGSWG